MVCVRVQINANFVIGAGFKLIGSPEPTWASGSNEEQQMAELEAVAKEDGPSLLFM